MIYSSAQLSTQSGIDSGQQIGVRLVNEQQLQHKNIRQVPVVQIIQPNRFTYDNYSATLVESGVLAVNLLTGPPR